MLAAMLSSFHSKLAIILSFQPEVVTTCVDHLMSQRHERNELSDEEDEGDEELSPSFKRLRSGLTAHPETVGRVQLALSRGPLSQYPCHDGDDTTTSMSGWSREEHCPPLHQQTPQPPRRLHDRDYPTEDEGIHFQHVLQLPPGQYKAVSMLPISPPSSPLSHRDRDFMQLLHPMRLSQIQESFYNSTKTAPNGKRLRPSMILLRGPRISNNNKRLGNYHCCCHCQCQNEDTEISEEVEEDETEE